MTAYPHGPDCIACTDPTTAAEQLAADHAELDRQATRAGEHRNAGEALRGRALDNLIADRRAAHDALDAQGMQHLQAANALASGVRFSRAHLQRVETAHPHLSFRRAESQGPATPHKEGREPRE